MSNLDAMKSQYRTALYNLTYRERLEIEYKLLAEMKQRVLQTQMKFDKLGGQSRMDSIEMCLKEIKD